MNNRLFTLLEIGLIVGLILAVLYFGGVFDSPPEPTPAPVVTATAPVPTATPGALAEPATPVPTRTPAPTAPPLVIASGLIAFNSTRTGNLDIFTMQADGSEVRNLTNDPADDYVLAWSPDGSRLAFFSTRTDWLELYVMNADGSNVVQLTYSKESQTAYEFPVTWSPDGSFLIALRRSPWSVNAFRELSFIDRIAADGSGVEEVYFHYGLIWLVMHAPAGDWVAMLAEGRDGYGTYAARLTEDGLMEPQPVSLTCPRYGWMSDGQRVTCSDGYAYFNVRLGSTEKEVFLQSASDTTLFGLLWSPNGQNLLLRRQPYDTGARSELQPLLVYDPSTGSRYREVLPDDHLPANDFIVWSWAPDSQWITFTSDRFGARDIFIVNIYDPNSLRQLTASQESFSPLWQP